MKSGKLKEILMDNNIEEIWVIIPKSRDLTKTKAIDLKFVPETRRDFILSVTQHPKPRENKTKAMISYLLSFKNIHNVYVTNIDSGVSYELSSDYSIKGKKLELAVNLS